MSAIVEHGLRIKLVHLFALLTLAAIFAGWYGGTVPATVTFILFFLAVQFAVFRICIEALTQNLPSSIHRLQRRNCRREDGTWSKRRARIEEKSRDRVRNDLAKAFLLIAIGSNVAGWFVHSEVIPLPLAIDAASAFHWDREAWREELRDDEVRLDGWFAQSSHLSPTQAQSRKRWLWRSWPLVLAGALVWVAGCGCYLFYAYGHALQELEASAQYRSEQYRLDALHKSVGHDDFAKARRRRGRRTLRSEETSLADG